MSNNSAKYETLITQKMRSIVDISWLKLVMQTLSWVIVKRHKKGFDKLTENSI